MFFGVVDAILFAFLAATLIMESKFNRLTIPECNNVPRNGTTDPHMILFVRAWQTNVTSPNLGPDTCHSFLTKWYLGLVILLVHPSYSSNIH